jgi:ribose/xylose/arabinose/galactoside ABC-type transport system permease subunit
VNDERIRQGKVWFARALLVVSLIGWPLSMLTVAKDEPPFVLSLSWLAIIIEAGTLLTSSQVHKEQGESSS